MYAYVELSNTARTDSIIQSLSWMSYISTPPSSLNVSNDENDDNTTQSTSSSPSTID